MNSPIHRRRILKLAGSLPLALPVMTLAQGNEASGLAFHRVSKQVTAAGVRKDTMVVVDAGITAFDGDGYYLYPDWGQPLVYQVSLQDARLGFYYPGASQPLWTMSPGQAGSLFSGRVEGILDFEGNEAYLKHVLAGKSLQILEVPAFPVLT